MWFIPPTSRSAKPAASWASGAISLRKVGPEGQVGGPIALPRNGDIISSDAEAGTLTVAASEAELSRRKNDWKPRDHGYGSGALWKYAQQVGPAYSGAVTHPGGSQE